MANMIQIGGKAKFRFFSVLISIVLVATIQPSRGQTTQKPAADSPVQKKAGAAATEDKPAEPPNVPPNVLVQLNGALESLAARVSPAVVQILVTGYGPLREEDRSQTAYIVRQKAVGSGVIVDSSGYIMTNAHVVEGAQRIRVALPLPMGDSAGLVPIGKRRILEARRSLRVEGHHPASKEAADAPTAAASLPSECALVHEVPLASRAAPRLSSRLIAGNGNGS